MKNVCTFANVMHYAYIMYSQCRKYWSVGMPQYPPYMKTPAVDW